MVDYKPKKRSIFRIAAGKLWFTSKRYFEWYFSDRRYAGKISPIKLPYIAFAHQTPLLRSLKNVDMWLQYNKINNLRIAVKQLDGLLVHPGETFSYWKRIGNPTRGKGYLDGMVLFYGGFRVGTGGGLCQLSNLIYWMTLHTPLRVVERHRHSYDVFPDSGRTQPFGSGATCVYNYRDLQILNDTENTYQLSVWLNDQELCGQWRCRAPQTQHYEVYEWEHRISQEYWGGYMRHNVIYRRAFNAEGQLVDDAYITENHALMMYPPFLTEQAEANIATVDSTIQNEGIN